MPTATGDSDESPEAWLPVGYEPRTVSPPPGRDDWEWTIAVEPLVAEAVEAPDAARPRPSASPPKPVETSARTGVASPAAPAKERLRAPETERLRAPEIERLRADLQQAERRARDAEERAERVERALERIRAREAQRPEPQPPPSPVPQASSKPAAARSEPPSPPTGANTGVDLNAATFESLRALGLSVNQSARLISQRDQRGGFRSLDELDGIWGMPGELIATLKRRCRI